MDNNQITGKDIGISAINGLRSDLLSHQQTIELTPSIPLDARIRLCSALQLMLNACDNELADLKEPKQTQ